MKKNTNHLYVAGLLIITALCCMYFNFDKAASIFAIAGVFMAALGHKLFKRKQ